MKRISAIRYPLFVGRAALLALSLATFALPASAQIHVSRATDWAFGGDLDISLPKGEFDRHTKQGFGLAGHVIKSLGEETGIGLRLDLGYINYGYKKDTYPCGTFCRYEATTTNNIIDMTAGGQFFMPSRYFTPYVHAGYGFLWFTTSSSVTGEDGSPSPFRHEVDADDITGTYVLGGGFYMPMGGKLGGMVASLGVRFYGGGEADYLTGDSVRRIGPGDYEIDMKHSRTEFWVISVGIGSSMGR